MSGSSTTTDRLVIKPIVVPRNFKDNKLHFYALFTVQPCGGNEQVDPPDHIPFCMQKGHRWPEWILRCLGGHQDDYKAYFVLDQNPKEGRGKATTLVYGPTIDVLTPRDMSDLLLNLHEHKTVSEMCALWDYLVSNASDYTRKAGARRGTPYRNVSYTLPSGGSASTSERNLVPAYRDRGGLSVAVNPQTASDLRPGLRLESLDHRMLVEALYSADTQVPEDFDALGNAAGSNGPPPLDPTGVHLVLRLGLTAPNLLLEFLRFQRGSGVDADREVADFVEQLWRTYGRASQWNSSTHEVQVSDRDRRFNELIRRRMAGNVSFSRSRTDRQSLPCLRATPGSKRSSQTWPFYRELASPNHRRADSAAARRRSGRRPLSDSQLFADVSAAGARETNVSQVDGAASSISGPHSPRCLGDLLSGRCR